jgi:acetolactate synthase-1/2/3 large subunit
MGAQVAYPDLPVLCCVGDGAVGFTLAEFDTMVRHNLPIVTLVMNNHSWGAVRHFQQMVSGADHVFATTLRDSNYHEVAAAFGCHAQHVTELQDLGPAIRTAFASGRPACINVAIDAEPIPPELHLLSKL